MINVCYILIMVGLAIGANSIFFVGLLGCGTAGYFLGPLGPKMTTMKRTYIVIYLKIRLLSEMTIVALYFSEIAI